MARNKLAPRRLIVKPAHQRAQRSVPLHGRANLPVGENPPTEIFTTAAGVRVEVLRLGYVAVHNRPKMDPPSEDEVPLHTHVLFLPGNPGLIEYYRPLLRTTFLRFPHDVKQHVTVHGLGLPGHDLRQLNSTNEYQIADHLAFCHEYVESDEFWPALKHSKLVVIGHSYGSHLGLRLIHNLDKGVMKRTSTVLLMPALYYMGRCAGRLTCFLLQDVLLMTSSIAWSLTALVPPIVRDMVLRFQGHCSGVVEISKAVVDGQRRGLYRNICSLARDEIRSILEPGDLKGIKAMGGRSLFVYADDDKWCPPVARARIQEAFGPGLQTEWAGEGVTHAFVLSVEQTDKVVRILAPWISEVVRNGR